MPGGKPALGNQLLDVAGEPQQSDQVDDGGAILPGALANFFCAELKFPHHAVERLGGLDRVEVLSLDVLDEGDLEEVIVGYLLDHDGDLLHARELGRSPPAFAGD